MITAIFISLLSFLLKVGSIFILVVLFIGLLIKKRSDSILRQIKDILKDAKLNAKKKKLKNLYLMTEDRGNAVRIGKIIGYSEIIEKKQLKEIDTKTKEPKVEKNEYNLFLVKVNLIGDKRLYKVPKGNHTKLYGDVTLDSWNFVKSNNYYIKNEVPIVETEKVEEYTNRGVNTIDRIKPLLSSAIQLDSSYKKQDRMLRLMKETEE